MMMPLVILYIMTSIAYVPLYQQSFPVHYFVCGNSLSGNDVIPPWTASNNIADVGLGVRITGCR